MVQKNLSRYIVHGSIALGMIIIGGISAFSSDENSDVRFRAQVAGCAIAIWGLYWSLLLLGWLPEPKILPQKKSPISSVEKKTEIKTDDK